MPVDYSKWDALELSDDSDIEVHPNVDKRSFIRAKQNQIHQQRYERRHQIETLKYERVINNGLLKRIDALLESLRTHQDNAQTSDPDDFMMQALMDSSDMAEDEPPKPPAGVHTQDEQPRYSQMMASLVDQVKKEIGEKPDNWYKSYEKGIQGHRSKVQGLQKDLHTKLAELEKEESRRITVDQLHDGFNTSSVAKPEPPPPTIAPKKQTKKKAETVEVLNPGSTKKEPTNTDVQSSGADADVDEPLPNNPPEDGDENDEDDITASPSAKEFAKLPPGDYKSMLSFISTHPSIVTERDSDGLLLEAYSAQGESNTKYAKQCVHASLLLQYCRSLGRDGVGLFFKRITTPGHNAQKMFLDDVNNTYNKLKERVKELAAEKAKSGDDATSGVEQIQLHAVEPGTEIHINIPQPSSTDSVEITAREKFDAFPPGLQHALESGSLNKVNEVLGKMSVEEAEEVVGQMGENGMLSMEEGVIDGTTEEGKKRLEELEREGREGAGVGEEVPGEEGAGDAMGAKGTEHEDGKKKVEELDEEKVVDIGDIVD